MASAAKGDAADRRGMLLRNYQLLVHARGEIEERGAQKMRMLLFSNRLWSILPAADLTNALKVRAFLGITGAEASTERHVAIPHRMVPYRLFLTLEQPDLIESVRSLPRCMCDAWSW